jgi:hypothetical protein
MKKASLLFLMPIFLFVSCATTENSGNVISETFNIDKLFAFQYEKPANPNPEQLSVIYYVLKNTYENNIHKMRGETENKVYTNADGREAVFDKDDNLVTNSYNAGSFNYFSNDEPIKKFLGDIAPWLQWGNAKDDPTSFSERLYYYTLDLDHGIQSYIFNGSKETLESVDFASLSQNEKEVYYIFLHLLFNETYKIQLNGENLPKLEADGEYYYAYFYQIQDILQVKQ